MPLTRAWAAPGRWRRHALVLALAHLHVPKGPMGCLHPSARPGGIFFANLTKRVSIVKHLAMKYRVIDRVIDPGSPSRGNYRLITGN